MCGLQTRPRTDVQISRDFWIHGLTQIFVADNYFINDSNSVNVRVGTDGLIGGETIYHRRTAIGGGISSRRSQGDTLFLNECNDNAFISDLWPIRPNRQLGLYANIHERKTQGYPHTQ